MRIGLFLILALSIILSCKVRKIQKIELKSIPSEWVELTKTDSGYIVFNSCDMGNSLIKISKPKNNYELRMYGTQEDYNFNVLNSTISSNDTIMVEAQWKGSDEKQIFKFIWLDKSKGIGNWITTYKSGHKSTDVYVAKEKSTNFPNIEQPCVECWGEECDEIERQNKIEIELKTKKSGQELFQSILDTIQVKPISTELLINNKWIYKPFENCEYYLQFGVNNKGKNYNCELEESFEITYKIEGNKLLVSEYEIPHVDNEEMKKIKSSDQTFAFNGHSLIMVDSKMYNIGGHEWTPQIEAVIRYEKK